MQTNDALINRYNTREEPLRRALSYTPLSPEKIIKMGRANMDIRIRLYTKLLFEKFLYENKFPVFKNKLVDLISRQAGLLSSLNLKAHNCDLTDPARIYALARYRFFAEEPHRHHHQILIIRRSAGYPNLEAEKIAFELLLDEGAFDSAFEHFKLADPSQKTIFLSMLLSRLFERKMHSKASDVVEKARQELTEYPPCVDIALLLVIEGLIDKNRIEEAKKAALLFKFDYLIVIAVYELIPYLTDTDTTFWIKKAKISALKALETRSELTDLLFEYLRYKEDQKIGLEVIEFIISIIGNEASHSLDYVLTRLVRKLAAQDTACVEKLYLNLTHPLSKLFTAAILHAMYSEVPEKNSYWEEKIRSHLGKLPQNSDALSDMMFDAIQQAPFYEGISSLPLTLKGFGSDKMRENINLALMKTLNRLLDVGDFEKVLNTLLQPSYDFFIKSTFYNRILTELFRRQMDDEVNILLNNFAEDFSDNPRLIDLGLLETLKTLINEGSIPQAEKASRKIIDDFNFLIAAYFLKSRLNDPTSLMDEAKKRALRLIQSPDDLSNELLHEIEDDPSGTAVLNWVGFLSQIIPHESRTFLDKALCEVICKLLKQNDPFSERIFPSLLNPLAKLYAASMIAFTHKRDILNFDLWQTNIRLIFDELFENREFLSDLMFDAIHRYYFDDCVFSFSDALQISGCSDRYFELHDQAMETTLNRLLSAGNPKGATVIANRFFDNKRTAKAYERLSNCWYKIPGYEQLAIKALAAHVHHANLKQDHLIPFDLARPVLRRKEPLSDEELFRKPPSR